jgi:hypothetical protein
LFTEQVVRTMINAADAIGLAVPAAVLCQASQK